MGLLICIRVLLIQKRLSLKSTFVKKKILVGLGKIYNYEDNI